MRAPLIYGAGDVGIENVLTPASFSRPTRSSTSRALRAEEYR
ncbi:MAG: hypothetical protein AABN95_03090 [Acidobacteriota bacterium]